MSDYVWRYNEYDGKVKRNPAKSRRNKKRLDYILINEKSHDGLLEVTLTANRFIKNISIHDELFNNKKMLEAYLLTILNKATNINKTELAAVAKEGLSKIPEMDMFK